MTKQERLRGKTFAFETQGTFIQVVRSTCIYVRYSNTSNIACSRVVIGREVQSVAALREASTPKSDAQYHFEQPQSLLIDTGAEWKTR